MDLKGMQAIQLVDFFYWLLGQKPQKEGDDDGSCDPSRLLLLPVFSQSKGNCHICLGHPEGSSLCEDWVAEQSLHLELRGFYPGGTDSSAAQHERSQPKPPKST